MGLILTAGGDPATEQIHFGSSEPLTSLGRRHHDVGVGRHDPGDKLALGGLSRHERRVAAEIGCRPGKSIEPEALVTAAVPILRVGSVAPNAAV